MRRAGGKSRPPARAARPPPGRKSHGLGRQHLIDACISALHRYGPSRTTVARVVAIAKMSPGIVRFYFDSKAAMLVASLKFLAAEFEERVMAPVAALKATPVAALERLVDLYLDPEIASPRKVSVWYAFWGEANSRQEYHDICGQKDETFAALVQDLVTRTIEQGALVHLDAEGVALGLIGALEILWQEVAFQTEDSIDRRAARARCLAYLASVFPDQFRGAAAAATGTVTGVAAAPVTGAATAAAAGTRARAKQGASQGGSHRAPPPALAGWAYSSPVVHAQERETLFVHAWQFAGDAAGIARAGDYLALDLGADRALIVRDARGVVRAFRNACPALPHALVDDGAGRFARGIECRLHSRRYGLDGGAVERTAGGDLPQLAVRLLEGRLLVASSAAAPARPLEEGWNDCLPASDASRTAPMRAWRVAADWKIVVGEWLATAAAPGAERVSDTCVDWEVDPSWRGSGWSMGLYAGLVLAQGGPWRLRCIFPNHLVENRPDGCTVLQAVPTGPGRCIVRRIDYPGSRDPRLAAAAGYLAARRGAFTRRASLAAAESVQRGIDAYGYRPAAGGAAAPAAWFSRQLSARLPILAAPLAPGPEHGT